MILHAVVAALLLVAPSWGAGGGAWIGDIEGTPEVLLDGIEPWVPAVVGQELSAGTQLRTGKGAAVVAFPDGSKVRVSRNALFTVEAAEPAKVGVFITLGRLECWVKKLAGRSFVARSPMAVAAVRGTVFAFNVNSARQTTIDLFSGQLAVNDVFGHQTLINPGQRVVASLTGSSNVARLPAAARPPAEPKVAPVRPPLPPKAGGDEGKPKPQPKLAPKPPPPPPPPPGEEGTLPPPPPPPNPTQDQPKDTTVSPSSP